MFNKIKNFLKKYKLVLAILAIIMLFFVLIISLFSSVDEEGKRVVTFPGGKEGDIEIVEKKPRYTSYDISLESDLVGNLRKYEGSRSKYNILEIDHKEWAENFVNSLVGRNFEYSNVPMPAIKGDPEHYMDQTLHFWNTQTDNVGYDVQSDLLSFSFENPLSLSGITINPRDEQGALKALEDISAKFFSADFTYEVKEVNIDGNYYRINFSRVLDEYPIFLYSKELYILVTPDGRLKEGRFLLAEFKETQKVNVISGEDLMEIINEGDHLKSIVLNPIDESVYERFDRRYFIVNITGQENAKVNLEIGKLVYYYTVKFQEEVIPQFLLNGEGHIELEGEKIDVTFEVLTDAISS